MLEGGEDPLYIARRLVRFASEDVGLADPQALVLAMAAQQAVHFIGLPEGALALAELTVYLAAAPRSNAVYQAYGDAVADALTTRAEPPPLQIRNAPTGLMKTLGYGAGYRYAHDEAEGVAEMDCLPDSLKGRRYYRPTARGAEAEIGERLEAARLVRERSKGPDRVGLRGYLVSAAHPGECRDLEACRRGGRAGSPGRTRCPSRAPPRARRRARCPRR